MREGNLPRSLISLTLRAPPEDEESVLSVTRDQPDWSKDTVAQSLGCISPTGVRDVWVCHRLRTRGAHRPWATRQLLEAKRPSADPQPKRALIAWGEDV